MDYSFIYGATLVSSSLSLPFFFSFFNFSLLCPAQNLRRSCITAKGISWQYVVILKFSSRVIGLGK